MTLYFENPVHFTENGTISTNAIWHPNAPLLAVASYSQDKGGFVTIFDELGEPISGITFPNHPLSQVTALAWHPERKILCVGWENGELQTWNENNKEFMYINGPHKAPVMLLEFSEKGSRLISCDSSGSLVGWKVESKDQIITAFHHDLKECITHLTFRLTVKNLNFDIEGLAKAAVNGDEQALDIFSNWRPKTTARKFRVQEGNDNLCFYVGTQEGIRPSAYINCTFSKLNIGIYQRWINSTVGDFGILKTLTFVFCHEFMISIGGKSSYIGCIYNRILNNAYKSHVGTILVLLVVMFAGSTYFNASVTYSVSVRDTLTELYFLLNPATIGPELNYLFMVIIKLSKWLA